MKVVEEYQLVRVEYLVNTSNKADALRMAKKLGSDVANLSNGPVFVKTQSYEVRDLTPKEEGDKVVRDAVNWWADCGKDAVPEPPKKRGRKAAPKAAKVNEKLGSLPPSDIDEIFGDML